MAAVWTGASAAGLGAGWAAAAFTVGANVLELRATLPGGCAANSVPLTVQVPADFPLPKHPFRPWTTYTTYDSGLSSTMNPPNHQYDPEIALPSLTWDSATKAMSTLPVAANCQAWLMFSPTASFLSWLM